MPLATRLHTLLKLRSHGLRVASPERYRFGSRWNGQSERLSPHREWFAGGIGSALVEALAVEHVEVGAVGPVSDR